MPDVVEAETTQVANREDTLRWYSPSQLKPWEGVNPRKRFDPDKMAQLKESIAAKGVRIPLLVHVPSAEDDWSDPLIIAGESRWRCALEAGVESIPCMVGTYTFAEALELALLENVQRNDLTPVEEARGYKGWLETHPHATQTQLAARIGKSQSEISNLIRLLKLPDPVIELVDEGRIYPSHARDFLLPLTALDDEQPAHAFRQVLVAIAGLHSEGPIEGSTLQNIASRARDDVLREFGHPRLFEAPEAAPAAPAVPYVEERLVEQLPGAVAPAETSTPSPGPSVSDPVAPPVVPGAPDEAGASKPAENIPGNMPRAEATPPPQPRSENRPAPPAPAKAAPAPTAPPAPPAEPVSMLPPPGSVRPPIPEGAGLIAAIVAATGGRAGTLAYAPLPNGRVVVTVTPKILKTDEKPFALSADPGEIDALLIPAIDTHFSI